MQINKQRRKQYGKGVISTLFNLALKPDFPNEKHAIILDPKDLGTRLNFTGPQTDLKKRAEAGPPKSQPKILKSTGKKSQLDSASFVHDHDYKRIGDSLKAGNITKSEAKKKVAESDKAFIRKAQNVTDTPITAKIAGNAINLKSVAERMGVLDTKTFSGIGPKPTDRLKQSVGKQEGGFAFLGPLVIGLVSSLASVALDKAWTAITKQKGEGIAEPISDEQKREEILKALGKIKTKQKQVNTLLKHVPKDLLK